MTAAGAARLTLAVACAASAGPALRGEDAVAAAAIWEAAVAVPASDRLWIDAGRVNAAVAPWQAHWGEARARVRAVADARRALLPHDRGGRRAGGG